MMPEHSVTGINRRRLLLLAAGFIVVQALIWFVVLQLLWYGDRSISDIPVYYEYAGRMADGKFPYRDFASEYPPVAMLLFSLPRLVSGPSYQIFALCFEVEMFLFSCGVISLMTFLGWRQWHSIKRVASALALYSFFILALGAIVKSRFDLAVGFLMLASVVSFIADRRLFAWMLLGVGLMTKIVPVLIAPVFLIAHYRRGDLKYLWQGPMVAVGTSIAIALPVLIASASGLAGAFLYHAERPLQLESSWASVLLVWHAFGDLDLSVMSSYGSHNVYSSGSDLLALVSAPVTVILLLAGYYIFWRANRPREFETYETETFPQPQQILRFSALAIATFIAGGKVLSPQFMIWLLPLVPLITGRDRRLVLALFGGVLILTQIEFPDRYWSLFMLERNIIVLVALRNVVLIGLGVSIALGGWRQRRQAHAVPAIAMAGAKRTTTSIANK